MLTGGLGPTADDLTRDVLAQLAGVPLEEDAASLRHVEGLLPPVRTLRCPPRTACRRCCPGGGGGRAEPPRHRPGAVADASPSNLDAPESPGGDGGCTLVALPGVPAEMKPMFRESVAPRLPRGENLIRVARVNLFGAGESAVEERLGDLTARGRTPEVGITAHEATITLRIVARGGTEAEVQRQFAEAKRVVQDRIGDLIFGEEDDTLAGCVLADSAGTSGETLAVVGTGTGGRLADWLSAEDDPAVPAFAGGMTFGGASPEEPDAAVEETRRGFGATFALFTPPLREPEGDLTLLLAAPGGRLIREPYRHAGASAIARSRLAKAALDLLRRHLSGRSI